MNDQTLERLFGFRGALDDPVTRGIMIAVAILLAAAPLVMWALFSLGRFKPETRHEVWVRYRSWLWLAPLIAAPILLGAFWTILAVGVLSLLCYREYARATGLFREKLISAIVVVGILAVTCAVVDHWYGFFAALVPLTVITIAAAGILPDQPQGYLQRVALGTLGFLLFGACFGHIGYMANDANYRPMVAAVLLCVQMNDVFAFMTGRALGRRKLLPLTSPKKTIAGSVGALVLTTALFAVVGHFLFRNTHMDHPVHLVTLGLLISVAGQLGDLMLSSIKRDLGIKDIGITIPGHGGLLDRFDSLILVGPAFYHYVGYQRGFGLDQPARILF